MLSNRFFQRTKQIMIVYTLLLVCPLMSVHAVSFESPSINATLIYSFPFVEYDFPDVATKTKAINDEAFIVQNNLIAGLKVYQV